MKIELHILNTIHTAYIKPVWWMCPDLHILYLNLRNDTVKMNLVVIEMKHFRVSCGVTQKQSANCLIISLHAVLINSHYDDV